MSQDQHNCESSKEAQSARNPNNCENCDNWKMQRQIEADDPEAMKLHCYQFRLPPVEVCMQHSGRKMLFFSSEDFTPTGRIRKMPVPPPHNLMNAPIQSFAALMLQVLHEAGYKIDDLQ